MDRVYIVQLRMQSKESKLKAMTLWINAIRGCGNVVEEV